MYGDLVATVELTNRSHVVWRLELLTAWGACTVLYSQPRAPPAIELVGFPGDGVPNGAWHPLLGAPGSHPHSGGMLSVLLVLVMHYARKSD